ncbi:MAG TPA: hypothetical protein VEW42_01480 [Candidatus Eisenbacteria bacterium]|nr:hypothetical protein [Candidatus Eisenbacteria bacterium]
MVGERRLNIRTEERNGGNHLIVESEEGKMRGTSGQWRVLSHSAAGRGPSEIGRRLGISLSNTRNKLRLMYEQNIPTDIPEISQGEALRRHAVKVGAISPNGRLNRKLSRAIVEDERLNKK